MLRSDSAMMGSGQIDDLISLVNQRFDGDGSDDGIDDKDSDEERHNDGDALNEGGEAWEDTGGLKAHRLWEDRELGTGLDHAEMVRRASVEDLVEEYHKKKTDMVRRKSCIHALLGDCISIDNEHSGTSLPKQEKGKAVQALPNYKEKLKKMKANKGKSSNRRQSTEEERDLASARNNLRDKMVMRRQAMLAQPSGACGGSSFMRMSAGRLDYASEGGPGTAADLEEYEQECRKEVTQSDTKRDGKCDEVGWNNTENYVF